MADDEADRFHSWDAVQEVVVGEVMTLLLRSSAPLEPDSARDLLARLVPGSKPERFGHPVDRLMSADLQFGVDCQLSTPRGARPRTIGVAAAHAVLTGGHVLQAAAHARIVHGETQHRRRWSYYASRPGYLEVQHKAAPGDLARGFLSAAPDGTLLDLAGIAKQVVDQVNNGSEEEAASATLHSSPMTFRWVARVARSAGMPVVEFVRCEDGTFQIDAVTDPAYLVALARFCEDVALHNWLLSTMAATFTDSTKTADGLGELGAALELLGHLWSPGEALDERLASLWTDLEARLYLSRGWRNQVTRVRDKITLQILKGLQQAQKQPASEPW